jgi:hypothetical protein
VWLAILETARSAGTQFQMGKIFGRPNSSPDHRPKSGADQRKFPDVDQRRSSALNVVSFAETAPMRVLVASGVVVLLGVVMTANSWAIQAG